MLQNITLHDVCWFLIVTSCSESCMTLYSLANMLNVIYGFSSFSRSTKAIFEFQKLRNLLEIAQITLIVQHFDQ